MNEPTPVHQDDVLDWLHEQGKRHAGTVPEFDLDATLRKLRAARNADAYARTQSQAHVAVQVGFSDAQARAAVEEARSDAQARSAAEEVQLISQIADGNVEEPITELYRRYAKSLYRFGFHVLGDDGLAEEMVQETFQRLWRTAGRFDVSRGSVGQYLFVIARSTAADIRKRPSSRPFLVDEDQSLTLPDSTDQILDSLIIREALDVLSPAHAEVLRLSYKEGLTQTEIAERLGLPLGTVKTRMFHGIRALHTALSERGFDTTDQPAHPAWSTAGRMITRSATLPRGRRKCCVGSWRAKAPGRCHSR